MPARELDPDLPEKPPPPWAAQVAVRFVPSVVTRQPRGRQVALAGFSLGLLAAGMIGGWGVGSALAPTPPSGDVAQAGAASADVSPVPAPPGRRSVARESVLSHAGTRTAAVPLSMTVTVTVSATTTPSAGPTSPSGSPAPESPPGSAPPSSSASDPTESTASPATTASPSLSTSPSATGAHPGRGRGRARLEAVED